MGVLIGLWLNVNFLSLGQHRSTALAVSPLPHALVQRQDHRGVLPSDLCCVMCGDLIVMRRGCRCVRTGHKATSPYITRNLGQGAGVERTTTGATRTKARN